MDSTAHISDLIEQLDDNLDNLQDALKIILSKSLTEVAADYPVLDRAKLYILITYAIESAIFSFLRLTGTSAREHPVYRELERVKQYFQKAKLAETGLQKPSMRLDQGAAGRFIKAALASNDLADARINKNKKVFNEDHVANGVSQAPVVNQTKKRKASDIEDDTSSKAIPVEDSDDSDDDSEDDSDSKDPVTVEAGASSTKTASKSTSSSASPIVGEGNQPDIDQDSTATPKATKKDKKKKKKNKAKKDKSTQNSSAAASTDTTPAKKKQKKNKKKKAKQAKDAT